MEKIIDKIGAFDFLSVFFVGILSNSIISISINANIFCYGETDFIKGMSFVALSFWHGIVIQQIALLIDQITFKIRDKYKHNYLDRKKGVFKIETDYNNCVNIILKIIGTSDITHITHKDCKYIYNYCKSYLEKSSYIHLINNTTTLLALYRNLSVLLCFFIVFLLFYLLLIPQFLLLVS